MKLYVPACGDRLTLIKDWEFDLFLEYRNMKFARERGLISTDGDIETWNVGLQEYVSIRTSLVAGTTLECERVYIRSFCKSYDKDYDCLTWRVKSVGKGKIRNQRFWAKLADCCNIEYEQKSDDLHQDRVKAIRHVMEQ